MDTLDDTEWDVVIGSTGLPESLLALSLSRSDKKILHLDPNPYYGGSEAALSLDEAEEWATKYSADGHPFSHTSIVRSDLNKSGEPASTLASSRAYALALAPQLIHARSTLIPALVSSQTHSQLEFQAVGSWYLLGNKDEPSGSTLTKVPNGREDVFSDTTMSLKAKRSLMKFLRFVATCEENQEEWQDLAEQPFPAVLEQKFSLPQATQDPLLALALTITPPQQTSFGQALPAIARHLRSIGIFGPGFGAVIPKWGGLAEISQVACRACAVGGGVYVLNKQWSLDDPPQADGRCHITLQDGERIRAKHLVTVQSTHPGSEAYGNRVAQSISIVSSPLASLFPITSEGGVIPAGAVIAVPSNDPNIAPVHIMVHSSEAGECPSTQCVLYASVQLGKSDEDPSIAFDRLSKAVSDLLGAVKNSDTTPMVLWCLQYVRSSSTSPGSLGQNVLSLPSLANGLALEDDVLVHIRAVCKTIVGDDEDEATFLQFDPRGGLNEED